MKNETILRMFRWYYYAITFFFVVTAIIERVEPGSSTLVKYVKMDPAFIYYAAFLLFFYGWAVIEGVHDGNKILKHQRIEHGLSLISRCVSGFIIIWIFGGHLLFSMKELIIITFFAIGGFSFIFTTTLNMTRGFPISYFTNRPNAYDKIYTIFPNPGWFKFTNELACLITSIIYLIMI